MIRSAADIKDCQVVREALGLLPCSSEGAEQEALDEVQKVLKPVMNQTWLTGRQNNRTP